MPSGARSKARPDGKPFTWSSPETPTNRTVAPLPAPGTSSNVNGRAPPWLRLPVLAREPFAEWSRCHLGLVRPGKYPAQCFLLPGSESAGPPNNPSNNGISVSFPDPPIKGRAQLDGKWPAPSRCFAVFRLPAFPDRHPSGLSGRDATRAEFLHADQYQAALKSATGKRCLAVRRGKCGSYYRRKRCGEQSSGMCEIALLLTTNLGWR